jgi:hypothetical protein
MEFVTQRCTFAIHQKFCWINIRKTNANMSGWYCVPRSPLQIRWWKICCLNIEYCSHIGLLKLQLLSENSSDISRGFNESVKISLFILDPYFPNASLAENHWCCINAECQRSRESLMLHKCWTRYGRNIQLWIWPKYTHWDTDTTQIHYKLMSPEPLNQCSFLNLTMQVIVSWIRHDEVPSALLVDPTLHLNRSSLTTYHNPFSDQVRILLQEPNLKDWLRHHCR